MATADDAFEQLMRLAGRPRPDFVRIDDEPPAMATRFQAEAGAAAALAAQRGVTPGQLPSAEVKALLTAHGAIVPD